MLYDYEEIVQIMSDLECAELTLESMVLNGPDERINRRLKEAMAEMRHALSDLSDVEFELATSPELRMDSASEEVGAHEQ